MKSELRKSKWNEIFEFCRVIFAEMVKKSSYPHFFKTHRLPPFKLGCNDLGEKHWKTNPKVSDSNPHRCKV